MPKRIVLETIKLTRDNKSVTPEIGKPFDFTADEIEQINAVRPQAFRKIIVEDPELAAAAAVSEETAAAGRKVAAAKAPAGKKSEEEGL